MRASLKIAVILFTGIFACWYFTGCKQSASQDEINQLKDQVQSLQQRVDDLSATQSNSILRLARAIRQATNYTVADKESLQSTREALETHSNAISEITANVTTLNQLTEIVEQNRETQSQMAEALQTNFELIYLRLDALERRGAQ